MTAARMVATVGGVGYLRPAPGTWGSAAAVVLAIIVGSVGVSAFVLCFALAMAAAWWSVRAVAAEGLHDPSFVVIDELVGQWVALAPVVIGAAHAGVAMTALWPGILAAFVLFRLFDISKPWLVGRADARGTPWSVIEDDLWAGAFAALGVAGLAALAHSGIMG